MIARLGIIERTVNNAAGNINPKQPGRPIKTRIPTRVKLYEIYAPTIPDVFYQELVKLNLPKSYRFADLGSGLGAACFTAALYFKKVFGFEINPNFIREARKVQTKLGFPNVCFLNENFLKMDLGAFQVLYVFHPFLNNFEALMPERVLNTKPGTIIIASICFDLLPTIFPSDSFETITPAPNIFAAYRRI